jgi:hypothetical protein
MSLMMMKTNPITPPQKLVDQWGEEWHHSKQGTIDLDNHLTTQAAQWGADQELAACFMYLHSQRMERTVEILQAARRPKPPSLKEQALNDLDDIPTHDDEGRQVVDLSNIRRALKALND